MISVDQALTNLTDLFEPLDIETVPLRAAAGRVLAKYVSAKRDQPPFAASAMDGYAILRDGAKVGSCYQVIGEAAAGSGFDGRVRPGQAARIFTGAPVPNGADVVVIQENVSRVENVITLTQPLENKSNIRPIGDDFLTGDSLSAPTILTPNLIALLASMNIADVPVFRRPVVAIVATGDELVVPGEAPKPDQIIASNNFGLGALLEGHGADVRLLPIARDTPESLTHVLGLCDGADLIVTIGGASVGDHDIVHSVASELGLKTAFYKVSMRPGKPLMAGKLGDTPLIGLPGNPVSSMVCGHVFLRPALRKMQGLGGQALSRELARIGLDMGANGDREHYMRASLGIEYSQLTVHPANRQDSALLSVLSKSNALLVRPPNDPAKTIGDMVEVIRL